MQSEMATTRLPGGNREAWPSCLEIHRPGDAQLGHQGPTRLDLGPIGDVSRMVGQQEPATAAGPSQPPPGPAEPEHHGVGEFPTDVDPQIDPPPAQSPGTSQRCHDPGKPRGAASREAAGPGNVQSIDVWNRRENLPVPRPTEHFDRRGRISGPKRRQDRGGDDRVAEVVELDQQDPLRIVRRRPAWPKQQPSYNGHSREDRSSQ